MAGSGRGWGWLARTIGSCSISAWGSRILVFHSPFPALKASIWWLDSPMLKTRLSCLKCSVVWKSVWYPESPLDCKEIKPVNPKGNQSWIFTARTDAEAEAPVFWPPDVKNWLIGKDPDAGEDWSQEKGTTEDEMVGWHHQLDGYEFEQALGDGEGQGSLVCCSP